MYAHTNDRLLDVVQASRKLGVHPATIRRRISDGTLPAFRVGPVGNLRILESQVDRLLVPYRNEKEPA